jgi:hypothetical protein
MPRIREPDTRFKTLIARVDLFDAQLQPQPVRLPILHPAPRAPPLPAAPSAAAGSRRVLLSRTCRR